jgi:molybdopterin-binding protein
MNKIKASIKNIKKVDKLCVATFEVGPQTMKMISLDLADDFKENTNIMLGVKASSIMLAKDLSGVLSTSNQLKCKIISLENGELLTSVKLAFEAQTLESVITKDSSSKMDLKVDDEVTALIKASELSILEVL